MRYFRYRQLNQREDLNNVIALFSLARALFLRSNVFKQPEDSVCATKYLSHFRDQPHEILSISRYQVTALLVNALALQVKLEAGNLSMADGPGEFMITSGSRLYRARSVRSVLTHCLQDRCTK